MNKENENLFKSLVARAGSLLPLPATITELIKLTSNPNVSSNDIKHIIEKDQAMTLKVLQLSNSAYYGSTQRIKTISHAIISLGFNKVKNLALTVASLEILNAALKIYEMKQGVLFRHSLCVAIGSSIIAQKTGLKDPEESYIMGLIHDVGKLIIDQHAGKQFEAVWESYKAGGKKFCVAEKETLGFDHADMGAEVARKWNFSNDLCNAIWYHHTPASAPGDSFSAYIVHLANGISKTIDGAQGLADGQDVKLELDGIFNNEKLAKMNLKSDDILAFRSQISERLVIMLKELSEMGFAC